MIRAILAAGVFIAASALVAEPSCSPNLGVQSANGAVSREVVLEAYINGAGPYAFLLDTGSQVTMIDESLASALKLKPVSKASVVGVSLDGKGGQYELVDSVRVGESARVGSLYVLAFDMKEMQKAGYAVRGLIGEDFLSHFDATIDNTHNRVCFTDASTGVAAAPAAEK